MYSLTHFLPLYSTLCNVSVLLCFNMLTLRVLLHYYKTIKLFPTTLGKEKVIVISYINFVTQRDHVTQDMEKLP